MHGKSCEVKSPVLYFLAVFPGTIIMCFASSLGHWIEDNIATLRGAEHIEIVAFLRPVISLYILITVTKTRCE